MGYMAAVVQGRPYIAVGRNLLIKREVLLNEMKRAVIPGVISGDDDLLITRLSFNHSIAGLTASDAHTRSKPRKNWTSYLRQKARHVSTSPYYRMHSKFLLQLIYGFLFAFYLCLIPVIFSQYGFIGIVLFILRYIILSFIYRDRNAELNMNIKLWSFPVNEILLVLIPGISWVYSKYYHKWN